MTAAMNAKHSPTPWRVYPSGTLVPGYQVCDRIVANEYHGGISEQLSDENAAFIVLACNSHDALIAENQALRNLASNLQPGPISEALVGARYERESALVAALEQLDEDDRLSCAESSRELRAGECRCSGCRASAALKAAKAAP